MTKGKAAFVAVGIGVCLCILSVILVQILQGPRDEKRAAADRERENFLNFKLISLIRSDTLQNSPLLLPTEYTSLKAFVARGKFDSALTIRQAIGVEEIWAKQSIKNVKARDEEKEIFIRVRDFNKHLWLITKAALVYVNGFNGKMQQWHDAQISDFEIFKESEETEKACKTAQSMINEAKIPDVPSSLAKNLRDGRDHLATGFMITAKAYQAMSRYIDKKSLKDLSAWESNLGQAKGFIQSATNSLETALTTAAADTAITE